MGSDFILDPQGVHQHSLEWPGGAYAPMHPPVSAPVSSQFNQLNIIPYIQLVINSIYEFELLILATFLDFGSRIFWLKIV